MNNDSNFTPKIKKDERKFTKQIYMERVKATITGMVLSSVTQSATGEALFSIAVACIGGVITLLINVFGKYYLNKWFPQLKDTDCGNKLKEEAEITKAKQKSDKIKEEV